jgi:hypothetical protein
MLVCICRRFEVLDCAAATHFRMFTVLKRLNFGVYPYSSDTLGDEERLYVTSPTEHASFLSGLPEDRDRAVSGT